MRIKRTKDQNGRRERTKEGDFWSSFFEKSKSRQTTCGLERKSGLFGLCENQAQAFAPSDVFCRFLGSLQIRFRELKKSREG